jgi:hypothetical protein
MNPSSKRPLGQPQTPTLATEEVRQLRITIERLVTVTEAFTYAVQTMGIKVDIQKARRQRALPLITWWNKHIIKRT